MFGTHKSNERAQKITWRYLIISGVDFVIDYYIVRGLKMFGISPYIGQFFSAGFQTIWNYFWYKYWVFAHKPAKRAPRISAPAKTRS